MLRFLKPRILCVDDEPSITDLLVAVFQLNGEYAVEAETDPLAVVDRARRTRPDLIILDINMPGRSGIDLARDLRREPGLCHGPIVFFSGVPEMQGAALKASGEGPSTFLAKGTPLAEIERVVADLLSERRKIIRDAVPAWMKTPEMLSEKVG